MRRDKSVRPSVTRIESVDVATILPDHDGWWFRQKHLLHLNCLLFFLLLTPASLGFDASMMNGLQSLDTWQSYFGVPTGAKLGLMNAMMPLGTLIGSLPAGWTSDKIGRRYTVMIGVVILIVAAIIQGCSQNNASFIASRGIVGIGIEFAGAPSPVLISELAYPRHRGKLTSLYQTSFYIGSIGSSWVTFGSFNISGSTWSWRIPSLLQAFFPLIQLIGLFFVPESPRWLIAHGRTDEARAIFLKYHAAGNGANPIVDYEMSEITSHFEAEVATAGNGWFSLIKTHADRKRMAICIFTAVIGNWSGNGIITYYLNMVLESVGITNSFTKTLINGILQIFNLFAAFLGALLVDRVGRRPLWIVSCAGMLGSYIVFTALSAKMSNDPSSGVGIGVLVMVFVYFFYYDIGVSPLTFAYPTEILPFYARQKGMSIVMFHNGIFLMINTFANPIALEHMGWKYYVIYVAILAVILVVVVLCFAETKGHSLEEIPAIFDGPFIVIEWPGRKASPMIVNTIEDGKPDKTDQIMALEGQEGPSQ